MKNIVYLDKQANTPGVQFLIPFRKNTRKKTEADTKPSKNIISNRVTKKPSEIFKITNENIKP